jgi:RNA polymerase sigma-70 factor (ECF subfamily)
MQSDLHTTELRHLLDRSQKGDPAALEELLRRAGARMERLARAMLRSFPTVRQREQTGDVVQEAMLSLLAALRRLSFSSTREFYGLAAEHIRRRLLDFKRRHGHPHRNHQPLPEAHGQAGANLAGDDSDDLDRWEALHEAVANLPADQREVFSLRLYHGWSNEEIADLLQVSTRTIMRLWLRAQIALAEQLGEQRLPLEGGDAGG